MLETILTLLDAINRKDRVRQVVSFCSRMPSIFEAGKGFNQKRCVKVPVLVDLLLLCVRVGGGYGGSFGQVGHCGEGWKKMLSVWKVQVAHNCGVPSAPGIQYSSVRRWPHRAVFGWGLCDGAC